MGLFASLGHALANGFARSNTGQRIDKFRHPGGVPTQGIGSLQPTMPTMGPMGSIAMPEGVGQPAELEQPAPLSNTDRMMGALMMKPRGY